MPTFDRLPRICFFGCGDMAARHAKAVKKLFRGIEVSFASRDIQKAKGMQTALKGAHSYGSYAEAAESDAFDISFLTTPHAFHADLAVLSADHGKDVIIEKPVTRTLGELASIQEAVERNGVRCTVAENHYFKPLIRAVRAQIQKGHIGDVLFLDLAKTGRQEMTGWRTDEILMGGGALLEGGVHWLNTLSSLSGGVPAEVIAARAEVTYPSNIPLEDSVLLVVRFSNGVVGRLLHSWKIPNRFFGLGLSKIYGTKGVITFESNGLFFSMFGTRKKKKVMSPFEFLGFRAMHRAFVEAWVNNRPWDPTLERIGQELRAVKAAYRSLKTHRFEEI